MKIDKATVTTNCKDDKFWRVKIKHPLLWSEESDLIPCINSTYLEKGDTVLICYSSLYDVVILGKLFDYNQVQSEPVGGKPNLFTAKLGETYLTAQLDENSLDIETSSGLKLSISQDSMTLETPKEVSVETDTKKLKATTIEVEGSTIKVKGDSINIEGTNIQVKGSTKHNGKAAPNGQGAWCGIPSCLFSGAPHIGNQTTE